MKTNKFFSVLLSVLLVIFTVSGCTEKIDKSEYDTLYQNYTELLSQSDDLKSQISSLNSNLEKSKETNAELKTELEKTKAELAAAKAMFSENTTQQSKQTSTQKTYSYIGNRNTKKFHKTSCNYLPESHNRIYYSSRSNAINAGMSPCKRCYP